MLAVAVAFGIASASERVDGGVAARTLNQDDELQLEDDSGQFMTLVFVEPQDQTDEIWYYPIGHTIARPAEPGALDGL